MYNEETDQKEMVKEIFCDKWRRGDAIPKSKELADYIMDQLSD